MFLWGLTSEGPRGGGHSIEHPVSWQAQAAAGVRTPATTVVTEKPKLTSGTGKVGHDQFTLCRGCLGGQ